MKPFPIVIIGTLAFIIWMHLEWRIAITRAVLQVVCEEAYENQDVCDELLEL